MAETNHGGFTRGDLLRGGAALGALATLGPAAALAQGGPGRSAAMGNIGLLALFNSATLNGEALFSYGSAAYGTAEIGEMATIALRINTRTGNPESPTTRTFDIYVEEFARYGAMLERVGRDALAKGQPVSARSKFLRASSYYGQALFFVLGTSRPGREPNIFRACERNWLAAVPLFDPPGERLEITTTEGVKMPAYFFRPDASGEPRPTVIICNGSDGQNVDLVSQGQAAGLERGYNVLLFEGPGQMSPLFLDEIPFPPDWAGVIAPIVETLFARPDVDSERIAAVGISLNGMVLSSAAAKVGGLAAVVLEPGAVSLGNLWGDQRSIAAVREAQGAPAAERARIKREVNVGVRQEWPTLDAEERFLLSKRGELYTRQQLLDARAGRAPSDYFGLLEAVLAFNYGQDLRRIRVPTLITHNQDDQFMKNQSPWAFSLLQSLAPEDRKLAFLDASIGGQLHDQPVGPQVGQEIVFDWLGERLGV
jgi:pimeloyl-ACP methyl ester carboxylesterase